MPSMPSLETNFWNLLVDKGFVRKLANCSWEVIGSSMRTPYLIFFLTRWQPISRYFILSWKTEFEVMCITLWLSQYRAGGLQHVIPRSFKMYSNHNSSHVVDRRALYSASNDDLAMVCCFLAFQDTREDPKKKQYPGVDFFESTHLAQSPPMYHRIWKLEFLEKNKHISGFPFKYWTTLHTTW